jgi:hypothetical protein
MSDFESVQNTELSNSESSITDVIDVTDVTQSTDITVSSTNSSSNEPAYFFEDPDEEDINDANVELESSSNNTNNANTSDPAPSEEVDLSKYTVLDADNLDEDAPIPGQEFALFSFMSPEGIMNCNVRLLKFRGAFPTLEKAKEYAANLKQKDKYFKIHCAESGKWVEFDPPEDHVEARMDKANEMAGRFKQKIDKEDRGAKNRIDESKKSGAAEDHVNRSKSKSNNSASNSVGASSASPNPTPNPSAPKQKMTSQSEAMRKRLQKRLAEKKQKLAMEATREVPAETAKPSTKGKVNVKGKSPANNNNNNNSKNLKEKTEAVYKASDELDEKKQELERTNANIEKIRRLMNKK